jgi:RNA polymerase sigma factor (sigma-70 family)
MSVHLCATRGLGSTPEATLFRQAQKGNRSALNQLMTRHERLVHAVLRRYGSGPLSYEEALQAGRIGLWHAILRFDLCRGRAFSTYAWPSIMRHIWRTVKNDRRQVDRLRPWALRLPRPAPDLTTLIECQAEQHAVHALVQRLAPRLRQTILAHYGLEENAPADFAQIGRTLGVSEERARQLHQEALIWLRQPAHSQALRSLVGRHTLADYQALEKLNHCWWRSARGRHGDGWQCLPAAQPGSPLRKHV